MKQNIKMYNLDYLLFNICSLLLLLDHIQSERYPCNSRMPKLWQGYTPKGQKEAGQYESVDAQTIEACVDVCCEDTNCNVAFMFNGTCFKLQCASDTLCEPVKFKEEASMVMVRPVDGSDLQWEDNLDDEVENDDLSMLGSVNIPIKIKYCDDRTSCSSTEECVRTLPNMLGTCRPLCNPGFARIGEHCVPDNINKTIKSKLSAEPVSLPKLYGEGGPIELSSEPIVQKITVSVRSKEITLPDDQANLTAFTVPEDDENVYNYKWEILAQPPGSGGTVQKVSRNILQLKQLTTGYYNFKVTVTGPNSMSGEAYANITVLPQPHQHAPPIAIVVPSNQTVKLPNSDAILDASKSHGDSAIIKYSWEMIQSPLGLGFAPNLTETPTLELKKLQQPGNYTFKLTVTDSEGAKDSTLANLTVLEAPDYPPEANAGPPVIVYLPKNTATLNGNLSTDDRGIVQWEWTKSPGDNKAVDMQNTRSPYLKLSGLEEGMYKFSLKVTDNLGQSSSSETHVLVKPPTSNPPNAKAGDDITIALPQTWVILNGTNSTSDLGIVKWNWTQISGPNKAVFAKANASITNITGLTKGKYEFQLNVTDNVGNISVDKVNITVNQNKNAPPKANSGGDQILELPVDVLMVNGSQSSDDLAIVKWQWTREPSSLAMGNIIKSSDTTPVLMLTNIVAGRYEFRLRVTDDQGEFSEDNVSINVKPDPELMNLVEIIFNIDATRLTQLQRDSLLAKLGLLLHDASQIIVRDLRVEPHTGRAVLTFYVASGSGKSIGGPIVVKTLKEKLKQDSLLLPFTVSKLRTVICQNNCSGHGVCEQETEQCLCESFWMEDIFNKAFGDGESNCDWSVLYVMIGLASFLLFIAGCGWAIVCFCSRICQQTTPKNKKYALLNNNEVVKQPMSKVIISDDDETDSDSDILFENRNGKNHRNRNIRNGFKSNRRIKT